MSSRTVSTRLAVYASAMEVDLWFARKPLPGAAAGHCIAPILRTRKAAVQSVPDRQPGDQHRAASGRSPAAALFNDFDAQPSPAPRPVNPSRPPHPSEADSVLPAFELCAVVHGDLLLVDDITGADFTASAYQEWLNAIFFAVDRQPLAQLLGRQNRLVWPAANPSVGKRPVERSVSSPEAASEMVLAWLERQMSQSPAISQSVNVIRHVLLMGDMAQRVLLPPNQMLCDTLNDDMLTPCRLKGMPSLRLPSTAALWAAPQLKQKFWQQLQLLAR